MKNAVIAMDENWSSRIGFPGTGIHSTLTPSATATPAAATPA